MEQKPAFYCIKLINRDGTRGWLFDGPKGISVITGGFHSDITQFDNFAAANNFIRERKIERRGTKAFVRSNLELMEECQGKEGGSLVPAKSYFYHLENHKGEKCFYDSTKEVYFFKQMGEAGFPVWYDENQVRSFVKLMKFEQSQIFLVKHEMNDKPTITLIQAYGCRKKEDGTLSEPEYFDFGQ